MNSILASLICLCVLLLICSISAQPIRKAPLRYVDDIPENISDDKKSNQETNTSQNASKITVIDCDCKLETSHPNVIEHKTKCPVFRERNPGLDLNDFFIHEGFSIKTDGKWPLVDPDVLYQFGKNK
jgi:hypothetical protein